MKYYQIRFITKENGKFSSGHYEYFECREIESAKKSEEVANAYFEKKRRNDFPSIFRKAFKPVKSVEVIEWDKEKRKPVRKGDRFKLYLQYLEYQYANGSKERDEWYAAIF